MIFVPTSVSFANTYFSAFALYLYFKCIYQCFFFFFLNIFTFLLQCKLQTLSASSLCALYQAEIILYSLSSKSSKGSRKRAKNHFSILQSCIKMYKIKLTIENKVYCKKMRQFKSFQVGKLCNQCESNKEIKKTNISFLRFFFSLLECKKLWKLLKAEQKEGVRLIVSLN